MCREISGISQDGGTVYDVTYIFQRAPFIERVIGPGLIQRGWDILAAYQGSDGRIPADVQVSRDPPGLRVGVMYQERDFRQLRGLNFD
jgi:hypothetical protein